MSAPAPPPAATGGPLAGVRVLEIGHYIAGPHAAQMLGDQGAAVIKVEPLGGDPSRNTVPVGQDGDSALFACHNRGKRSVAVDLRSTDAALALDPLLRWADILITNYTRAVPERLGFGWTRLHRLNPRAVMVHITGYDVDGPWRDYAAFDGTIAAMSGLAEMTGAEDGPPLLSHVLIADHSVGAHAAFAAAVALAERDRTGAGRLIEMNMLDVMTTYLGHHLSTVDLWNISPTRAASRSGTRFTHLFDVADGKLFVAAISVGMWRGYARFVGHSEWAPRGMTEVPDFLADALLKQRAIEAGVAILGGMTAADAMAALQAAGVTCGTMRSVRDVHDQDGANGSRRIHRVAFPDGTSVTVPGAAIAAGASPSAAVPSLGSDSAEVLLDLGVAPDVVVGLLAEGVIAEPVIDPNHVGRAAPVPDHLRHRIVQPS